MATIFDSLIHKPRVYFDRALRDKYGDLKTLEDHLLSSVTVYVGNLSFNTFESQIHEHFSIAGPVRRVIMGLNRQTRKPCGFCFVEYFNHEAAQQCMDLLNQTKLDGRIIRTELDEGFTEGRQFGKADTGGQKRDVVLVGGDGERRHGGYRGRGYRGRGYRDRGRGRFNSRGGGFRRDRRRGYDERRDHGERRDHDERRDFGERRDHDERRDFGEDDRRDFGEDDRRDQTYDDRRGHPYDDRRGHPYDDRRGPPYDDRMDNRRFGGGRGGMSRKHDRDDFADQDMHRHQRGPPDYLLQQQHLDYPHRREELPPPEKRRRIEQQPPLQMMPPMQMPQMPPQRGPYFYQPPPYGMPSYPPQQQRPPPPQRKQPFSYK